MQCFLRREERGVPVEVLIAIGILLSYGHLLCSAPGFERESSITDCEDVSYVSSPYLPTCIRSRTTAGRPTTSNAHLAHLCAKVGLLVVDLHVLCPVNVTSFQGATNIRDELSEVMFLSDVKVRHHSLSSPLRR